MATEIERWNPFTDCDQGRRAEGQTRWLELWIRVNLPPTIH
jgi:hypothetical protein